MVKAIRNAPEPLSGLQLHEKSVRDPTFENVAEHSLKVQCLILSKLGIELNVFKCENVRNRCRTFLFAYHIWFISAAKLVLWTSCQDVSSWFISVKNTNLTKLCSRS